MIKVFVEVTPDGIVKGDIEIDRKTFDGVEIPAALIEVTGHAQWAGRGSLIGWTRQPDGSFTAPAPRSPVVDMRSFFRLFTPAEVLAIAASRQLDPDVEYFWLMVTLGATVDLGQADTSAGLDLLVSKALLTADRKAAILANKAPSK